MTPEEMRECRDCGLLQAVPALAPGSVAHCSRCNYILRRASRYPEKLPLICMSVSAVLFCIALVVPFMEVHAPGHEAFSTVWDGPKWLWERGLWPLAILVVMVLIALPAFKIVTMLAVLVGVRQKPTPPWIGRMFRWSKSVSQWAMIEVFILGSFVAYTRLGQLAHASIQPGLWLLGGVMLTMITAEATLDVESIWDATETNKSDDEDANHPHIFCHGCGRLERAEPETMCSRCGDRLHRRRPQSITTTWALTLTGLFLYLPANMLPVMTVRRLGQGGPNTILSGISELAEANLLPLAILVFVASFVVPIMKLVGITTMLLSTHFRARWLLKRRTQAYRVIEAVGRWSMIDIFVLSTLVGLVHMGFSASIIPGWGAVSFGGVVVVTMIAATAFDPRLMWDAAQATPAKSAENTEIHR